ncbi:MAG TPA: hypothetical protein PKC31_00835 [Candidatus Nanoperiomorbaceae bacterium]|nr:hypothetical protein [Candidatus Nanoperiomorbaceae bacterium]
MTPTTSRSRAIAASIGLCLVMGPVLASCSSASPSVGGVPSNTAAPVPAQTDKPVEPNGPATKPTTKETDKSGNPCVGPTFAKLFDATACLRDSAGYDKAWPTTKIAADGDGVKDDWLVRTEGGDGKDYAYHEDGTLKQWSALK